MQEAMQEEIESIALAVREHWELDLSPISNLQLTLEENGIVITGFDTVDRKIDAFSQRTLRTCIHNLKRRLGGSFSAMLR